MSMEIYIVGGAVRDKMLGMTPKDIDYMVCGATVDEFLARFPSAIKVGRDFPVFIVNGDEYAFARTEKRFGHGHTGFTTNFDKHITVSDDLCRRDLTINSMAMRTDESKIFCVKNSFEDIKNKVIRHTSDAFSEDPLRVFRVARFASELEGFTVAPETMSLLRDMKNSVRELSAERVFKELKKALQSKNPHRFFEVLRDCDCLSIWFPEIANLIGVPAGPDTGKHKGEVDTFDHTMRVVKGIDNDPVLRFSGLCHDLGKALSESPPNHRLHDKEGVQIVEEFCLRLKVPKIYKKSAKLFCKQHIRMHRIEEMNAGKACRLITDIVNGMHLGVSGFLVCSVGDFMTAQQANRISIRADKMLQVRLPKKHIGRGSICSDILLQERCKVWKSNGDNIS